MANLNDSEVRALLEAANHAVVSTLTDNGGIESAVVWVSLEGDELAVNSARGRKWPTNLERDPHVTLLVYPPDNPYEYVEIRGTATGSRDDADDHIDRLAKKYLDADEYPARQPGEERIKYTVKPDVVRYQKQS